MATKADLLIKLYRTDFNAFVRFAFRELHPNNILVDNWHIGGLSIEEIASEKGFTPSYAARLLRLAFLSPELTTTILAGKQPPELTARKLMADTRLPLAWCEQRTALGLA